MSIRYHTFAPSADASGQRGATYGQGSGPILLDQVQCFGNESNIFDCPQNDIGMHNCIHDQDAGVTCTARESSILHTTMRMRK
jgi:nitrate reductase beta subunit